MNKVSLTIGGLLLSMFGILSTASSASAHVLITDTSKEIGAILHIQPDDDPVAGQSSHIYYDIQNQRFNNQTSDISLEIKSDESSTDVPITVDERGINADYTFPTVGVYTLILMVNTSERAYFFEHTQRVSRAASSSSMDRQTYEWAEILLITTSVGLLILCITVFNKRKAIKAHSAF